MSLSHLVVNEIYRTVQGEALGAGRPCTLVRLTGCDLRCRWCDTAHAFHEGAAMSLSAIEARVRELGADQVLLTGGEPLLQDGARALARALLDAGTAVAIETGGHRSLAGLDRRAEVIMDIKCPGSGESGRNDPANVARLKPGDQLKLVLADRADYRWARDLLPQLDIDPRIPVYLSPVHGALDPAELVSWMLADGGPARLGLQIHKLVWAPDRRGV